MLEFLKSVAFSVLQTFKIYALFLLHFANWSNRCTAQLGKGNFKFAFISRHDIIHIVEQ